MPRQAGLDTPGALHHIMVRGMNRSGIFDDDEDRCRFLTRLGRNILETQSFLYAQQLPTGVRKNWGYLGQRSPVIWA